MPISIKLVKNTWKDTFMDSFILNILTAITAFIAAVIWFLSAIITIPKKYTKDMLADAVRKQSKLSAIAATSAGLSALLQAISFLFF